MGHSSSLSPARACKPASPLCTSIRALPPLVLIDVFFFFSSSWMRICAPLWSRLPLLFPFLNKSVPSSPLPDFLALSFIAHSTPGFVCLENSHALSRPTTLDSLCTSHYYATCTSFASLREIVKVLGTRRPRGASFAQPSRGISLQLIATRLGHLPPVVVFRFTVVLLFYALEQPRDCVTLCSTKSFDAMLSIKRGPGATGFSV